MKKSLAVLAATLIVALSTTGCATRQFVRQEIAGVHTRADTLETQTETQIEHLQTRADATERQVAEHDEEIEVASETALQALERAIEAGKLAQGKLLWEASFADDAGGFGFDKAELSDTTRAALDEVASRLKTENRDVYIEIQGHTDGTGTEQYNLMLGEQRAEAASRYLNMAHGIPLHRMATISYGESAPAADNDTREGRARNRRVVVVVLA